MNRWLGILPFCCACLVPFGPTFGEDSLNDPRGVPVIETEPAPAQVVATPQAISDAIERGVRFLLDHQNKDGSWGSPHFTKGLNIYAPVPGAHLAFRSGTTGLAIAALCEAGSGDEVDRAIERGEAWLFAELPKLRRATPDAIYNVWGHAYCIQALVRLARRPSDDPTRPERIRKLIESQIGMLERYESIDGGWGYYDFRYQTQRPTSHTTSFTSATVLIALDEARGMGIELPEKVVERALASIRRQQKPDFSYLYGEYLHWRPMREINRHAGSLGRSQACNLALRRFGDERITNQVLDDWLNRLIDRNLWLDIGRKRPIPHEAWFQVAGYFYYYGHYYAALCLEALPSTDRPRHQQRLAETILPLQEKDGSWWDYPLYNYHPAYGTAFALMTLVRCLPDDAGAP